MQRYQCDLRKFLGDCLSFMQEQLALAVANAEDQVAAVDAASGAIPLMRERLSAEREPVLQGQFWFHSGEMYERSRWREVWDNIGKMQRTEFLEIAFDIQATITEIRLCLGPCDALKPVDGTPE